VRVTVDLVDGRTGTALVCPDDATRDTIHVLDLQLEDGTSVDSVWLTRGLSYPKHLWMPHWPAEAAP
jgi:hypothetical protein